MLRVPTMLPPLPDNPRLIAAIAAALLLIAVAQRVRVVRVLTSLALTAGLVLAAATLVGQRAAFDPVLERVAARLGLGEDQQVVGHVVRIRMSPDGHFWARARLGGIERRMLVDSGATITAIAPATAADAGLTVRHGGLPVILQTANGAIRADTATVPELRLGDVVARDLPVVVSPAFGRMNVLGMNFLSRLRSWRVEGSVLILEPHHPQPAPRALLPAAGLG